MRLGQLSRKLGIGATEIVNFLSSKDVFIGEDSNTKIDDLHAQWVTEKYAPHLLESITSTISEEKQESIQHHTETIEVKATSIEKTDQTPVLEEQQVPVELIKAPKIELSGLKVLGKIELPEKKKKEPSAIEEQSGKEKSPSEKTKLFSDRKQNRREHKEQEHPKKNRIALQREREEREAEKQRKEKALREKERKTYNYLSRVKTKAPTKKSRFINEQVELSSNEMGQTPPTWWGKFKRWLTT
jgi:hypothetical protein